MERQIDTQKVINFLIYLIVGLVPLIFIPINGVLNTSISKLAGLAIISLFFLFVVVSDKEKITFIQDTLENRVLGAYVLFTTISVFFSLNWQISLLGSSYRYDGLIAFYLYLFAYLIARNGKKLTKVIFPLLTVTSVLIAIYGVLQFYKIDPVPLKFYALKWEGLAFSTMGNPNFLGSYLVLSIPMPIYLYFYKSKWWGLLAYAILFLGLLATRTRGAWLGAFIALVAFLILHGLSQGFKKKDGYKILAVAITSMVVIMFFTFTSGDVFFTRLFSIFIDLSNLAKKDYSEYLGGAYRVYVWGKVIQLILMRPIFGFGLDTMYIAMEMYFREAITQDFGKYKNWDKAHNEYLNIGVSSGIFALFAYVFFLFLVLKKGFRRMTGNPAYVPFFAAIIGYLVQAFFNIQVVMVYYVFFAYLGLVTSDKALEEDTSIFANLSKYRKW